MKLVRLWWLPLIFFVSLLGPINLFTADLGRHLKNGELILEQGLRSAVLFSNYYSYTFPDFPAINHHWLFGVISYLFWKVTGFTGLNLLNALLITVGFWFGLLAAKNFVGEKQTRWLVLTAALVWPLLVFRTEIRPESISFALAGIYWWMLTSWKMNKLKNSWMWLLVLMQLIWANSHIFFPLGIFLVGTFWFESLIEKNKEKFRFLSGLLMAMTSICFVNPFGWRLLVAPFRIFENYNYLIVENQSPFFLLRLNVNSALQTYLLLIILLTAVAIFIGKKRWSKNLPMILVVILTLVGSLKIMRVYPYFGLFAFSLFAFVSESVLEGAKKIWLKTNESMRQVMVAILSLAGFGAAAAALMTGLYWPNQIWAGIGLLPKTTAAADFYQSLNLPGRVFNNYDIGGYLIYFLPNNSVFVDNRPAEYPGELFDQYRSAQTDLSVFNKLTTQYQIDSVFFYRHDLTPWAQEFMHLLVESPDWVPVYVDQYAIIFVSNVESNQTIIEKYQIPNDAFSYG